MFREVRALQNVHHRNVVDYKHSWLEHYQPAITGPLVPCLFILMEYADGGNVQEYVMGSDSDSDSDSASTRKGRKWLCEHEIWSLLFEVCMGLKHLHSVGIVHRDLKPGNLLMSSLHRRHRVDSEYDDLFLYDTNYRILLSDLGQSEFLDSECRGPRTGNTGTLGFAAPELVLKDFRCGSSSTLNSPSPSEPEWNESVDIWSLGHLLYFLSFSEWPYDGLCDDEETLYRGIVSNEYKLKIPKHGGFRSEPLLTMMDRLCRVDPDERPSLRSVIHSISNILKSRHFESISISTTTKKRRSRRSPLRTGSRSRSRTPTLSNNGYDDVDGYRPRSKSQDGLISPSLALPAPPGLTAPDLSMLPVVQYVPKKRRKKQKNGFLRNRRNRNGSLLQFEEESTLKNIQNVPSPKTLSLSMPRDIKLTLFLTLWKPTEFVMTNGALQMAFGLVIKMELILKYIDGQRHGMAMRIYLGVCCVLLSVMHFPNDSSWPFWKRMSVVTVYGLLSVSAYIYALTLNALDGDDEDGSWSSIMLLCGMDMVMQCGHIYFAFCRRRENECVRVS